MSVPSSKEVRLETFARKADEVLKLLDVSDDVVAVEFALDGVAHSVLAQACPIHDRHVWIYRYGEWTSCVEWDVDERRVFGEDE